MEAGKRKSLIEKLLLEIITTPSNKDWTANGAVRSDCPFCGGSPKAGHNHGRFGVDMCDLEHTESCAYAIAKALQADTEIICDCKYPMRGKGTDKCRICGCKINKTTSSPPG